MRISWKWLNEFCKIPLSPEEAAERLTVTGCEVENIERPCSALKGLVVGKIERLQIHPERPDLFVAEVDLGGPRAQCVTAARNLREGDTVPYGAPGSVIADGTVLGKRTFDSVVSVGMMLSAEEIGLPGIADEFGILRLPAHLTAGEDLLKALNLDDCILEISITPNRGDLLSLMGLARECYGVIEGSTLEKHELKLPRIGDPRSISWEGVTLEDPGCPLYGLSFAPSVQIGPSPMETRIRLAFSGIRSINNIVDATNYIMLVTGQPLHAFDLDRLPAREITVRGAREGERFRTLDGQDHTLAEGDLLITSGGIPVALAGVMGGENSEIKAETKSVAFESAFFEPLRVSRTARRLGMGTEASYRFSRGVDPSRVLPTLSCLYEYLLKDAAQHHFEENVRVVSTRSWEKRRISLTRRKMHRVLLWDDLEQASKILQKLDLREISATDEKRVFEIPTSRADLYIEEDLIEEVGRLRGYESVPSRIPPLLHGTGRVGEEVEAHRRIRVAAMSRGYLEIVTYSFINPKWVDWLRIPEGDPRSRGFRLTNPISQEQSLMRTTLLPGLLQALQTNLRSGWKDPIRLFEVGRVFLPGEEGEDHRESLRMAGVSWNGKERRVLHETSLKDDVLSIKADVMALCGSRGQIPGFSTGHEPFGHAGQTAQVSLEGKPCGYLTSIKPGILRELEIPGPVFAFELEIESLLPEKGFRFGQVVRYPAVYRDISLIAPVNRPAASVEEDLRRLGGTLLRELVLFDVYQGPGIPEGTRSLAFSLAYGDPARTLRDEEVDAVHEQLRLNLSAKGYVLR